MSNFGTLLRKEMREQWRTFRLPIIAIIFLVFGLSSPLLARYTPEIIERFAADVQIQVPTPTTRDAVAQLFGNLGQLGPFAAILLAMGSVAAEKARGTAALVLTKPVSRSAFLGAKFTALLLTLLIAVVVAGGAAYFYTALLFETMPVGGFIACCALLLLALVVFSAITFLGSTVTNAALPAAGIGILAFFVAAIVSVIPEVGDYVPFGLYDPATSLAVGEPVDNLFLPVVFNLVLVVASLLLAWFSFSRQEIGK